jgi:hypothetical protein
MNCWYNSKVTAWLLLCLLLGMGAVAQTNHYKFDFGTDKTAKGYIAVTPSTIFSYERGYGLHQGSETEAIDRGGNPVKGDFITARQPAHPDPDGKFIWYLSTFVSGE